jgi:hypothetical protein
MRGGRVSKQQEWMGEGAGDLKRAACDRLFVRQIDKGAGGAHANMQHAPAVAGCCSRHGADRGVGGSSGEAAQHIADDVLLVQHAHQLVLGDDGSGRRFALLHKFANKRADLIVHVASLQVRVDGAAELVQPLRRKLTVHAGDV